MYRATAVALVALLSGLCAPAAERYYEGDFAFVSKYVWRGMVLTDGPSFQPGMTGGCSLTDEQSVSLNVWASEDLDDANDTAGEFGELDFTLDYTYEGESIELSLGAMYYTYPNYESVDPTTELYLCASYSVLSLEMYKDVGTVEGLYAMVGASHSLSFSDTLSLDLSLSIGYGDKNNNRTNALGMYLEPHYLWDDPTYENDEAAAIAEAQRVADDELGISGSLTDLTVGIALSKSIEEMFSVSIELGLSQLQGDFAEAVDHVNGNPQATWMGVRWTAEF